MKLLVEGGICINANCINRTSLVTMLHFIDFKHFSFDFASTPLKHPTVATEGLIITKHQLQKEKDLKILCGEKMKEKATKKNH